MSGTHHLSASAVVAQSGLARAPIFRASALAARARLAALPAVRDSAVEISLPDRARIAVSERAATGRWVSGGTEWLVDAEGVLFASVDPAGAPTWRVVDDRGRLGAGDRVDPALVAAALRLAQIAPGELRDDETRPAVRIESGPSGLVLQSGARWEVRFGGPERIDEKLAIVRAYLRSNPTRPLDYVDVARPDLIVVRP